MSFYFVYAFRCLKMYTGDRCQTPIKSKTLMIVLISLSAIFVIVIVAYALKSNHCCH